MAELNRANRQTCDVLFTDMATNKTFLKFDSANTTTAGMSGENTHAMAKGVKRIAFPNPLEGTMKVEAQVYPFKLFALFSDGTIKTDAVYADSQVVVGESSGKLTLTLPESADIVDGTVFAYPADAVGDEASLIEGTYLTKVFTATQTEKVAVGTKYCVCYFIKRTSGVKRISFNDKTIPKDYKVTMRTVDKDENGLLTPFLMTAYHATPKRNFELAFSSEGDPATVTVELDMLSDSEGNVFDMIELTEDAK